MSSPCSTSDHHGGTRETWPSSLLGGKWKNYLKCFRACLGSPCLSHSRTGQTCSLLLPPTFDPIHTELSTFFLEYSSNTADQTAGLLCQRGPHSVGLHLQGAPSHKHITQQGMAGGSSPSWGAWATGSPSRAAFPTSWQFADTGGHLPFCHIALTEVTQRPHQLWSPNVPCQAFTRSYATFPSAQPQTTVVFGEFFEQQVTKGSFSFLVKPCIMTKVALGPAELCQPQEPLHPFGVKLSARYLLPQPEKPLQRDDKGIQMLQK